MNKNNAFCLAPWVHSHINFSKNRALCCMAKGLPEEGVEIDSFWNSEHMKSVRLQMLKGSPPPEDCRICLDQIMTSSKPWERFEKYREYEQKFYELTDADGGFNGEPIDFDFRLENTCNLQCRMCNEEASSQIERTFRKILSSEDERLKKLEKQKEIMRKTYIPELKSSLEKGSVRSIYWASGEAFMQQNHWDFVREAKAKKIDSKICLEYNSNFSYPPKVFQKYLSEISSFGEIGFVASIDGFGITGEFIRDGLRWDYFEKNLSLLQNSPYDNIRHISFQIVLTIPTLLNLEDLLEYLSSKEESMIFVFPFAEGQSALLSPLCLSKDLSRPLIEKCMRILEGYKSCEFYGELKSLLLSQFEAENEEMESKKIYELLYESFIFDLTAKRKPLIDYYLSFPETRLWIEKIVSERIRDLDESYYALDIKEVHFFQKVKAHFDNLPPISILCSYPSSLHMALNPPANHFIIYEELSKSNFSKRNVTIEPSGLLKSLLAKRIKSGFIDRGLVEWLDKKILSVFPQLALQANVLID